MSDIVMGVHDGTRSESELFRRVSWGAIFSGTLVALSVELVFLTFGLFIGFRMADAAPWTVAWYLFGIFCSLFIGGWVAGRLAGNPNRGNGMMHGFVVWGLSIFTSAAFAVTLLWDVVRAAGSILRTAITTPAVGPGAVTPANMTHLAATAAIDISNVSLIIWVGLLLAIAGALIGGAASVPREIGFVGQVRPHLPEQSHA